RVELGLHDAEAFVDGVQQRSISLFVQVQCTPSAGTSDLAIRLVIAPAGSAAPLTLRAHLLSHPQHRLRAASIGKRSTSASLHDRLAVAGKFFPNCRRCVAVRL